MLMLSQFILARMPKLGLTNVSNKETHHAVIKQKQEVLSKSDVPKMLGGYLGWGNKPKESFTTQWNNTGANAAKSLHVEADGLQAQKKPSTPKQALVASVSTAYTRKLQDDLESADLEEWPTLDWGAKAKPATPKLALKAQTTDTKSNSYLAAVGWTASALPPPKENSYLDTLHADPNKKFLAAAEVKEKKDSKSNKYFDALLPDDDGFQLSLE